MDLKSACAATLLNLNCTLYTALTGPVESCKLGLLLVLSSTCRTRPGELKAGGTPKKRLQMGLTFWFTPAINSDPIHG